ncbi:hypothetical protein AC482_02155 [miscellaneous Crenarchaeota group-15 archaeon DG-45]|uniref:Molybdenum cofactor biosynthesis protein MoaE n=1 Tax=miscellaneous Crenarchaeota group-15 archaeon DG-45 TaxID=1685127 RepID=A0A0M0BS66_9ARCH|nr:MAG: hypothetical protein AC482_02155 [miscellaneous Crenarchaeota group-15 archaeon DG-45]
MIKVSLEDFSVDEVLGRLRTGRTGAIVAFVGVVRGESRGRQVERIEIQAYEEMARSQLEAIRREAMERFGVEDGLKVSDDIMMIAAGAAHRAEAFDACRYVLEQIKMRVPIWKKEVTPEGDFWVEGEAP